MPTAAHHARKQAKANFSLNLFKPRATFSHAAGKAAYAAGLKSGDTGLFDQWFRKSKWKNDAGLRGQLQREYERGFEVEHARATSKKGAQDSTRRTQTKQTGPGTFKGFRIYQADGAWKTSLEPESDFDTEADVKAFIVAQTRKFNPASDGAKLRKVLDLSPSLGVLDQAIAFVSGGRRRNSKRNPEDAAAAKFEEFHGMPSGSIEVIEERHRYHENLAELGDLCKLVVHTVTGLEATFCFGGYTDKINDFDSSVPSSERPLLTTSEDGKQMYVIGGDQELDLGAIKMDSAEWLRDSMVIGKAIEVTYQTRKKFDGFAVVAYFHQIAEESGVHPDLVYDHLNKTLAFVGGQYHISPDGEAGSIFN